MALFKIFRRKPNSNDNSKSVSYTDVLNEKAWISSDVSLPPLRLIIFRENEWKERRLMYDSETMTNSLLSSPSKSTSTPLFVKTDSLRITPNKSVPISMDEENMEDTTPTQKQQRHLDSKALSEMIFGSFGTTQKGDTVKLHRLKNPSRFMMAHVFQLPQKRQKSWQTVIKEDFALETRIITTNSSLVGNESDSDSQYSTVNSMDSFLVISSQRARSKNIRIPCSGNSSSQKNTGIRSKTAHTLSPSPENDNNTTGGSQGSAKCYSTSGTTPSTPTPITASWKSLQMSFLANSFDSIYQRRHSQNVAGSSDEDDMNGNFTRKRLQVGIAVLFPAKDTNSTCDNVKNNDNQECFQRFLFSHMQIIEAEFEHMKKEIARSCYLKKSEFMFATVQAWNEFVHSLKTLLESPRLAFPVWSTLTGSNSSDEIVENNTTSAIKTELAIEATPSDIPLNPSPSENPVEEATFSEATFIDAFCELIEKFDTRETNFFISTALTTFLTLHSGWVSSVAPPTLSRPKLKANLTRIKNANYCDSKNPAANVFTGQLYDLWSVFNSDRHSLRTIFTGQDKPLLLKLVFVFSYFLRCNLLKKKKEHQSSNCTDRDLAVEDGQIASVSGVNFSLEDETDYVENATRKECCARKRKKLIGNEDPCSLSRFDRCTGSDDFCEMNMNGRAKFLLENSFKNQQQQMPKKWPEKSRTASGNPVPRRCDFETKSVILGEPDVSNPTNNFSLQLSERRNSSSVPSFLPLSPPCSQKNMATTTTIDRLFDSIQCSWSCGHFEETNLIFDQQDRDGIAKRRPSQSAKSKFSPDCNNNQDARKSMSPTDRFEDPALSLQTSFQRLSPPGSSSDQLSLGLSISNLNANFALTALYVKPFRKTSTRGVYGRATSTTITAPVSIDASKLLIRDALAKTAQLTDANCTSVVRFLVGDCRDWSVKVMSCDSAFSRHYFAGSDFIDPINTTESAENIWEPRNTHIIEESCLPARAVLDMIDNLKLLKSTDGDPEFIMMYIEDWMGDLYRKGAALAAMLDSGTLLTDACRLIQTDLSDAPLLLSVCVL